MSRDVETAGRLAALLPAAQRGRYAEQWAADFRDADEVGLDRRQLIRAAARVAVAVRGRQLLRDGWRSPLPWVALYFGGLAGCLIGAAAIGLNLGEPKSGMPAAILVLMVAAVALTRLAPRLATRAVLLAGITLSGESFAVSWLGHEGSFELVVGIPLLLWGLARGTAEQPVRSRTRTVTTAVFVCGAALLVGGLSGAAGRYLDYRLNPGGFNCLEGFSGDPDTYPDAPANPNAITTGFSWNPIGRTCTWTSGQPTAINGSVATATVNRQTDLVTSNWIYGTAIAGASLLILGIGTTAIHTRLGTNSAAYRRRATSS